MQNLGGDLLVVDSGKIGALAGVLQSERAKVAGRIEIDLDILVEIARLCGWTLAQLDVQRIGAAEVRDFHDVNTLPKKMGSDPIFGS